MVEVQKIAELNGHSAPVFTVIPFDEPHRILTGSGDLIVAEWDLQELKFMKALTSAKASIFGLAYLDDRKILVVGQRYGGIHVIDLKKGKEIHNIEFHKKPIYDLQYLPSKKCVIALAGDGQMSVWSVKDWKLLTSVNLSTVNLRCMDVNSDNSKMAVGGSDNSIKVFDIANYDPADPQTLEVFQKPVSEFEAHENSVFTLKYSQDGKQLLSGGRDAYLNVWDVEGDYALIKGIPAHNFTINSISFKPDQKCFATGSRDKTIKIWDAENYELIKVIDKERNKGHINSVNKVFWTDYNDYLISCSDDKQVMVWKVEF